MAFTTLGIPGLSFYFSVISSHETTRGVGARRAGSCRVGRYVLKLSLNYLNTCLNA